MERQQDAEIRREKERKAQNASIQKQISQNALDQGDENGPAAGSMEKSPLSSIAQGPDSDEPEPMETNPPTLKIEEEDEVEVDVEDTSENGIAEDVWKSDEDQYFPY